MAPFRDMRAGETLDGFHKRCVVPTQEEIKSFHEIIDGFVRFLHKKFNTSPYTVAEVLKSGSLGKDTATRLYADIDLVVNHNGLSSIADLTEQRPQLLKRLAQQVNDYHVWKERPRFQRDTGYSLQYTMNGHKLDILPAMNIKGVYEPPTKAYEEMKSSPNPEKMAQEFSASLAHLQIEFVEQRLEGKEKVKKVIQLLKFWKYENNVGIRSYTLELLTIYTSDTTQWSTMDSLFRNVLSKLMQCHSLEVAFDRYYNSSSYTRHRRKPYVLDPANPYMDTMEGTDVNEVSGKAREMLDCLRRH